MPSEKLGKNFVKTIHLRHAIEDLNKINTDDIKVICAVNILLENERKAKKKLDEMSDGDREMFMTYPIYNLL